MFLHETKEFDINERRSASRSNILIVKVDMSFGLENLSSTRLKTNGHSDVFRNTGRGFDFRRTLAPVASTFEMELRNTVIFLYCR